MILRKNDKVRKCVKGKIYVWVSKVEKRKKRKEGAEIRKPSMRALNLLGTPKLKTRRTPSPTAQLHCYSGNTQRKNRYNPTTLWLVKQNTASMQQWLKLNW